ncbi:MAG TPA: alpha/beta hydrolase [Verrucomicrobia bacterium]|nr:alpha/beta hydrolase [Verrucomicrobiota bacterium]HOB32226.1 alpha/beta hydrolase [Verrucomicrobiota bacterium]HOP98091.1 alpha/beta hydrolase [Verrucomicrobiota bacterium]HPU57780.1 alpha/beta hydrolase [Verrucomicrobiota bacterium]
MTEDVVQVRTHGDPAQPTLVYLPGTHGDWTLIGNFRRALRGRLHFVELTYPRTLTWSLEEYAAGVESALTAHGIARGWLLGESFGSQVVWHMTRRKVFHIDGVILAGGFVRHPNRLAVRVAERICGDISLTLLTRILFGYAKLARRRYQHLPEMQAEIDEFMARRTELDRQAAKHRLHLIAQSDPCALARDVAVPVFALTGFYDPVVPWPFVRRWLRKHCPSLRAYRIMRRADHNVLSTAATACAEQVIQWITPPH